MSLIVARQVIALYTQLFEQLSGKGALLFMCMHGCLSFHVGIYYFVTPDNGTSSEMYLHLPDPLQHPPSCLCSCRRPLESSAIMYAISVYFSKIICQFEVVTNTVNYS